jgi:hypothetical protein
MLILSVAFPAAVSFAVIQPIQTVTSTSFNFSPISTVTTTSTVQQNLLQESFTVNQAQGPNSCWYIYYSFSSHAGPIVGSVASSSRVDFILASMADYNAWVTVTVTSSSVTLSHSSDCDGPLRPIVRSLGVTSYNFSANLPNDGEYAAIAINKSPTSAATVSVLIQGPFVFTQTTTSFATITHTQPVLMTQTSILEASSQTSTPASGPLGIPGFPAIAIAIGLTLGLAAVTLRRKRRK